MSLTPKQEHFAQCVAKGMTQADAYRTAYDVSPETTPQSIAVNGSKLMADANISQRVKLLKDEISAKNLWTREDSVNALKEAIAMARDGNKLTALTGAVKELNVMHGFNAPQKIDLLNSDGSLKPTQIVITAATKPADE
jgi:hypothetical protein